MSKGLLILSTLISKYLGHKIKIDDDWDNIKVNIMKTILKKKFEQHPFIKNNLLNTGLRPLVEHTRTNSFWGDGGGNTGLNMLGKILTEIRNEYYLNS